MVGEQIAQFSFTSCSNSRRTLVSLGLVGEDLEYKALAEVSELPVVTKTMVDQMSTFGTHTESCEVENGEEA